MTRASAAALAATLLLAGCDSGAKKAATPGTNAVKDALAARLHAKQLSYQWIACVNDRRSFRRHRVVRCNVNFGEPHIEVYCAVLDDGHLLTDHDDAAIRCGRRSA